jgi:hypothetical protein
MKGYPALSDLKPVSVKLDNEAHSALEYIMKVNEVTASDAVRLALHLVRDITKLREYVNKPAIRKKQARKATDFDKALVAKYQETFDTKRRVFWPAAITTIRAAQEKGITDQELMGIVSVAPLDSWVQQMVKNDDPPSFQQLISESMIGRLLPLLDEEAARQARQERLSLESAKPAALRKLQRATDNQALLSVAYDEIQDATSEEEVRQIVAEALVVANE